VREVGTAEDKTDRRDHPPQGRTPRIEAVDNPGTVGEGGPEHRLARGLVNLREKRDGLRGRHFFPIGNGRLAHELDYTFDVIRLREQIDQVQLLYAITGVR
jgi:hypothetical protein